MTKTNESFLQNVERLKEFKARHGHVNVPFVGHANRMLAKWAHRQRARKDRLSVEEQTMLEELGFNWERSANQKMEKLDAAWDQLFQRLQAYKLQHGDCLVPLGYGKDPELGTWVANQRKLDKKDKVRDDRRERLRDIGFCFQIRSLKRTASKHKNHEKNEMKWKDMFRKLKEFQEKHGHCNVPYNYDQDLSLALWVTTQRREYSQKSWYGEGRTIRQDRKELLDSIGFCWNRSNPKGKGKDEVKDKDKKRARTSADKKTKRHPAKNASDGDNQEGITRRQGEKTGKQKRPKESKVDQDLIPPRPKKSLQKPTRQGRNDKGMDTRRDDVEKMPERARAKDRTVSIKRKRETTSPCPARKRTLKKSKVMDLEYADDRNDDWTLDHARSSSPVQIKEEPLPQVDV